MSPDPERPRLEPAATSDEASTATEIGVPAGRSAEAPDPRGCRLTEHDLYLFNEGTHFRLYEKLGAHPSQASTASRHVLRRLGAQRRAGLGHRRLQRLATRRRIRSSRAAHSGHLGGLRPGVGAGAAYKYHIVSRDSGYRVDKADPFALPRRDAAAHRLDRLGPRLRRGTTRPGWRPRARATRSTRRCRSTRCTSARGGASPSDGNRCARAIASSPPPLAEYVAAHGLHARRVAAGDGAPVLRLVGLPDDRLLRADQPLRHAAGLHVPGRLPAPARHRRDPRLGAVALPHRRARPRLLRRHAPLRARRSAPGLPPRLEAATSSTTAATRCAASSSRSALFWLDSTTSTACASTPWPRCSTSTTRARQGEWIPNQYGGRENLEAIEFLRQLNEAVYARHPDVQTIAEESTAWPMVSRPDLRRRPRLRHEVGHGLDARHAAATCRSDPIHRSYHHNELTFRMIYAFTENFVLPLSHDEVVHGKGSLLGKMPGDDWQKFANLRLLFALHVRAARQEAAVHGRRVRPVAASGTTTRASTGTCCDDPLHAGAAALARRPEPALPRRAGAARAGLSSRPASSGSTATTPSRASSRFLRARREPATTMLVVAATSRRCRATTTASACRAAATGARC